MITNRVISVEREDTKCENLSITKYRNNEGNDGVLLVAWHMDEETLLIQTDFIEIEEVYINDFIRDYSQTSAQNYVNRYKV